MALILNFNHFCQYFEYNLNIVPLKINFFYICDRIWNKNFFVLNKKKKNVRYLRKNIKCNPRRRFEKNIEKIG